MKNLELWEKTRNGTFSRYFLPLKDVPAVKRKLTKLFVSHLSALQKQFSFYFKVISVSKLEWDGNPFAGNIFRLTACE
jgi:hypothetical protein